MGFYIESDLGTHSSTCLPGDTGTQLGGAGPIGGAVKRTGNWWNQSPAGGLAPAGTGADYVVAVATIFASALDIAGRAIDATANGSFASNTDTKTVKIIVAPTAAVVGSIVSGGTTIASTGPATTSGLGWVLGATIAKTGAAGSNTQNAIHFSGQCGASVSPLQNPVALTLVENAPITVAITINCATAAADAKLWNFQGEWFN